MFKKAIHHFNKGLVIGLEIIGFIAVVAFVIWLALMWRLSQGPLNIDFLTDQLENKLNEQQSGFVFNIGKTVLAWGGNFEPFELEMQDVRITRQDMTPVLAVEKVGVQVSKRNIVFGRIVPKVIRIYGPALRIIRWEDGRFTLNLGAPPTEPEAKSAEKQDAVTHATLVKNLLQQLENTPSHLLLGGLEEVRISNAAAYYEDKILDVAWRADRSDIVFARGRAGLAATVIGELDMGEGHKNAIVRTNIVYSWKTGATAASVYFGDFVPAFAAQESRALQDLAGIEIALKGKIAFRLDEDFKLDRAEFIVGSDPGRFNALGLYPQPLDVRGLYLKGYYSGKTGAASIDQLQVNLGGPTVQAQVQVTPAQEGRIIGARAVLNRMPLDDLHRYWPEKLTPDPRAWVTKHLSTGIADKATLEAEFLYTPEAEKKVAVRQLGGHIDFHDIKVDYFPPLMPVLEATGRAAYDAKAFTIDVTGGKLGDMAVTKSKILIAGLDQAHDADHHSTIDISASVEGPLKTALEVIDSKPLEYPRKLDIKTAAAAGQTAVDITFKFPLHKALTLEEVKVTADARITDMKLADMVAGYDVTGGPFTLKLDGGTLGVSGGGKLGHMPVTFDWQKNFSESAATHSRLTASLTLDAQALGAFGIPADLNFMGEMPANVTYTVQKDKTAGLALQGDLTRASFEVPVASFAKPMGAAGAVSLTVNLRNGKPEKITGLDLATGQAVVRGGLDFKTAADGSYALSKANFTDVRLGETKVSLKLDNKGSAGYAIDVRGDMLDASSLFKETDAVGNDAETAKKTTPLKVTMAVKRLMTGKDKFIDNIKLFLHRNDYARLEQLEVDGVSGGKPVYLRYTPGPKGHTLRFEAGNAGSALNAMGFTRAVRGGSLVIRGDPYPRGGPRDMAGTAVLTNFTLQDVPVLAKLLNAMSLPGIIELLNNKGVSFKKARANFTWTDRGPPTNATNMRLLKLKDGQTSGASLGLTFEGNIDNWKQLYDLSGTIIPVSDLNKLLAVIPIVGDVLTAGGEGVFAATYTIRGPKDQPTVTVNPLAALAPGVLRKLFFEN